MLYVDNRGSSGLLPRGAYRVGSRWSQRGLKTVFRSPSRELERVVSPVISRVERGDGGKREQGDSGWKSRQGSGNSADTGWSADRQSERGDFRKLARQGNRRAQGKDRMASRGHFQRRPLQGRRAVSEEGRQGLPGRPVADAQMDRPERRREILHRGGTAGLQLELDHARRPQRGRWR